jgi:hypothetical protein
MAGQSSPLFNSSTTPPFTDTELSNDMASLNAIRDRVNARRTASLATPGPAGGSGSSSGISSPMETPLFPSNDSGLFGNDSNHDDLSGLDVSRNLFAPTPRLSEAAGRIAKRFKLDESGSTYLQEFSKTPLPEQMLSIMAHILELKGTTERSSVSAEQAWQMPHNLTVSVLCLSLLTSILIVLQHHPLCSKTASSTARHCCCCQTFVFMLGPTSQP